MRTYNTPFDKHKKALFSAYKLVYKSKNNSIFNDNRNDYAAL